MRPDTDPDRAAVVAEVIDELRYQLGDDFVARFFAPLIKSCGIGPTGSLGAAH